MIDHDIHATLIELAASLTQRGWLLVTAESCTGGWVAKSCTDLPGSSAWFDRGYVAYSYPAKVDMLQVRLEDLEQHGAVSEVVVRQMVEGALRHSSVHAGLALTGIAGPGGGLPGKPVGTVWFAWGLRGQQPRTECKRFLGDRDAVRHQTVLHALKGMLARLQGDT